MQTHLNDDELFELEEIYKIFGSVPRLKILIKLSAGECTVNELSLAAGLSQSATSHQLKDLKLHRVITSRKEGLNIFYAIKDKHILEIIGIGIDHIKKEHCNE
jgi:ArsR family transcriptional regulator